MPDDTNDPEKLCFVIGPIGTSDSQTRRDADFLLEYIIRPVLGNPPFNYFVKRADEDVKPGSINAAVLNDVMTSVLAIADLSERNANAFYELGIRHAVQKPVIHMVRSLADIPFDIIDQRAIDFSTDSVQGINSAKLRLADAVRSIENESGPVSNPVTMAVGMARNDIKGDSKEQIVAAVIEQNSVLNKRMQEIENYVFGISFDDAKIAASVTTNKFPRSSLFGVAEGLREQQEFIDKIKLRQLSDTDRAELNKKLKLQRQILDKLAHGLGKVSDDKAQS